MEKTLAYLLILGISAFISSCAEVTLDPQASFTKIYDHEDASAGFKPIDIVALTEGYLILASKSTTNSSFAGVTLHRINAEGDYVREIDLSEQYVLPTGKMSLIDSVAYFVAMDPVSLEAVLISITSEYEYEVIPLGNTYPLAVNWSSNNELILLSYDPQNLTSELSLYSLDGSVSGSVSYSIGPGSDPVANILNHYTDPERNQLPFFCGEWSTDNYFFNGFYNYSLSVVFTNLNGNPTGVIQGQGTSGGLSAIEPIVGSIFSIVGFQFNEVFLSPDATLSTNSITSSIDLMTSPVSEFKARTNTSIESFTVGADQYIAVGAETESRQIALYFYSNEGELIRIEKIGYINPYTISSIKADPDGSLLVLGTTYVGGRFERIYLQKISADTIADWLL